MRLWISAWQAHTVPGMQLSAPTAATAMSCFPQVDQPVAALALSFACINESCQQVHCLEPPSCSLATASARMQVYMLSPRVAQLARP
jgi:hypothetical protein